MCRMITSALLLLSIYAGHSTMLEFSVIQCLTGWCPEVIDLQHYQVKTLFETAYKSQVSFKYATHCMMLRHPIYKSKNPILAKSVEKDSGRDTSVKSEPLKSLWTLLEELLPRWKWVDPPPPPPVEIQVEEPEPEKDSKGKKSKKKGTEKDVNQRKSPSPMKKANGKNALSPQRKPNSPERKLSSPVRRLSSPSKGKIDYTALQVQIPHYTITARYTDPPRDHPIIWTDVLKDMTQAPQILRELGLSCFFAHLVLLNQVREGPMVSPEKPLEIPRWKLIRKPKSKHIPVDLPYESVPPKLEYYVEILTTYLVNLLPPISEPPSKTPEPHKLKKIPYDTTLKMLEESEEVLEMDGMQYPGQKNSWAFQRDSHGVPLLPPPNKPLQKLSFQESEAGKFLKQPDENVENLKANDSVPVLSQKQLWITFEEFYKSFRYLCIFHRLSAYAHHHRFFRALGTRKSLSGISKGAQQSFLISATSTEDKSVQFIFIDNLKPTEIIFCFSAMSQASLRSFDEMPSSITSRTSLSYDEKTFRSASVTVDNFMWKSVIAPYPLLKITTNYCKTSRLQLPEGRHVLKVIIKAKLIHVLNVFSISPFIFGDEDIILNSMANESCRFVQYCQQLMNLVSQSVQSFSDPLTFQTNWNNCINYLCPYTVIYKDEEFTISRPKHIELFFVALQQVLLKTLSSMTASMQFAWRVFTLEVNFGKLPLVPSSSTEKVAWTVDNDLKTVMIISKAAMVIQKFWRGYYMRKLLKARNPANTFQVIVADQLNKAWKVIDSHGLGNVGISIMRNMIYLEPDLIRIYPFKDDEDYKMHFWDYFGCYTENHAENWNLLFRDVFYCHVEILMLVKFQSLVKYVSLRVIDNDTLEETPRQFGKLLPKTYQVNKKGYTIIAETFSKKYQSNGKWRLRLFGNKKNLPTPSGDSLLCNYYKIQLTNYYFPNKHNILFRYVLDIKNPHLLTFHLAVSSANIYLSLKILDYEETIYQITGKYIVSIPAIVLEKSKPDKTKSLEDENSEPHKPHKYIIQGTVLYSWPLDEEKIDKLHSLIDYDTEKRTATEHMVTERSVFVNKSLGNKGLKDKNAYSRYKQLSVDHEFDSTLPHYNFHLYSDVTQAEEVIIKADVTRREEIEEMKMGWEKAQPGRAKMAEDLRSSYLARLDELTKTFLELIKAQKLKVEKYEDHSSLFKRLWIYLVHSSVQQTVGDEKMVNMLKIFPM